jgi:hypothetical protein
MGIAKVHTTAPLKVQLKGSTVGTPATLKRSDLPAVSVGDDVWVEIDEGKVVVLAKLASA